MYGDDEGGLNYGPDRDAPAARQVSGRVFLPSQVGVPQAPIPPGANVVGPGLPGPAYNAPPPGGTMAAPIIPEAAWHSFGTQGGPWSPNLTTPGGTSAAQPVSQLARPVYGDPYGGYPPVTPIVAYGDPRPGEQWQGGGGFRFLLLPDGKGIQVVVSPPGKPVGQVHPRGSAGWNAIVAEYNAIRGSSQSAAQQNAAAAQAQAPRQNPLQAIAQAIPQIGTALSLAQGFQPSASYTPPAAPVVDVPPPPPPAKPPYLLYAVLGATALAVVGGGAWWLLSGSGERKKNPPVDPPEPDADPDPDADSGKE